MEDRINAIIARLIDPAIPFQKKWVYHYSLSCSYSIKNVLPFVAPDLSYDKLAVNNGLYASQLFQQMMAEPNKDWTKERNDPNLIRTGPKSAMTYWNIAAWILTQWSWYTGFSAPLYNLECYFSMRV